MTPSTFVQIATPGQLNGSDQDAVAAEPLQLNGTEQEAFAAKPTQQAAQRPAPVDPVGVFILARLPAQAIYSYFFPPSRHVHLTPGGQLFRYSLFHSHWKCFLIGLGVPYQICPSSGRYRFLVAAEDDHLLAGKVQATMDVSLFYKHPGLAGLFTASNLFKAFGRAITSAELGSAESIEIVRPEQVKPFRPSEWKRFDQPMGEPGIEMVVCVDFLS